jgi:protein-tyrosine phosphatase
MNFVIGEGTSHVRHGRRHNAQRSARAEGGGDAPRGVARVRAERDLDWDGCFNARDLGDLRTHNGHTTRRGAVVRSDSPDRLTSMGWAALHAHGIRTIIDLRNDEEREGRLNPAPPDVATLHVPLDDIADAELWERIWADELDGSPLYYRLFMDRKPERCVAAVRAVARAGPGGVLIHCSSGRDRTGLITMLLLAIARVAPDDIASDYELSTSRLRPFYAELGEEDQGPQIEKILGHKETSARAELLAILEAVDVVAYLRSAGLHENDLKAVRARLLD